jgi:hypothetical protein
MSESEILEKFRSEANRQGQATDTASVPVGWQPYAEYTDQIGEAIVRLPAPNATEKDLLISAGFDPAAWKIAGPINTRRWMRTDQEWLYYYKFDVVAGESEEVVEEHIDDLVKKIRKGGTTVKTQPTEDDAFVVFASDWQIGKAEGGIGTSDTVERVMECFDKAAERVRELRKTGRTISHGALIGMGDIVEGCNGNYSNQLFIVDRNRRDQNKIARELISYGIDTLSPLFEEFTVGCVHGNHGEHRHDGKKITDDADNDDTACFETVKEAYDRAGQQFNWHIPDDEMSVALTLGGVKVGFTHGHIFRKGSTPAQKALEWFKSADFGFQPVRGSQILFSAHFHHLLLTEVGHRTLIQCPAADPGSKWYRDSTGEDSPPGMLTVRLSKDELMGYSDLQVLRPSL